MEEKISAKDAMKELTLMLMYLSTQILAQVVALEPEVT